MSRIRHWVRWIGLPAVDVTALLAWWPQWSRLAANVTAPHRWIDRVGTDQAALTLATAALWCVALWLALGLAALAVATGPGRIGTTARRLAARLLPAVLLRTVAGMAGLGVLVAPIAPVAAGADTPPHPVPAASAVVPAPSWPTTPAPPGGGPRIGWPTDHAPAPGRPDPSTPPGGTEGPAPTRPDPPTPPSRPDRPASTRPDPPAPNRHEPPTPKHPRRADQPADQTRRPPADQPVRVQPGDSLWLIAARRLGPDATDEQIVANWPRWYAANRAVIGDDPSLIDSGQVLHAPPPTDPAR